MTPQERANFLKSYSNVLNRSWTDSNYMSRLTSDPAGVLRESGLTVPAGVQVSVQSQVPTHKDGKQGTVADLISQWESGVASGNAVLYLPPMPALEETELSDEQLSAVAGGASSSSIISCCCCC
jgi:hypothetical protein